MIIQIAAEKSIWQRLESIPETVNKLKSKRYLPQCGKEVFPKKLQGFPSGVSGKCLAIQVFIYQSIP